MTPNIWSYGDVSDSFDDLKSEEDQLAFVQAFQDLICLRNVLIRFTEYVVTDLDLEQQVFEDYKSKYLDIYDKTEGDKPDDAASIIDEADFAHELIQRDEINVAHILALLAEANADQDSLDPKIRDVSKAKRKMVYDLLGSERRLRSKRNLIEKVIEQLMPRMTEGQPIADAFNDFWDTKKSDAIVEICATEKLETAAFTTMIAHYHFWEPSEKSRLLRSHNANITDVFRQIA